MGAPPQQIQVNDLDRQRSILLDVTDGLYQREYIDNNIDHVVSDFDQQAMDRITMTVVYENGNEFVVPLGNVPVVYRIYVNGQWYTQVQGNATQADVDHYVRRNHVIYPVDKKENIIFSNWLTPNIVDLRSKIYNYVQQASQLLEMAELVYAFSGDIAALGSFAGHLNSFKLVRAQKPTTPSWSEGPPGRRPVGLPIVWDDDDKSYKLSRRAPSDDEPRKAPASPPPPPPPGDGGGQRATYRDSLQRIQNWLKDPAAFNNGRPVFKSIGEFHEYWTRQKFVLVKNDPFGPEGGRQLIYRGPDNTVVKIKTAGYSSGPRMGRATMSLEITDGDGENWANTLCKVDANGKIIAKNLHNLDAAVVELPPEEANANSHYGIRNPRTGKVQPLTKFEVLQGGQGPPADQQAWADRGHLDLTDGFNVAGAADLK
jgi:hypothetical protein